ncbi:MAG: hypothetical protein ACRCZ2_09755 [Fusobacteriaceae bacterium]
MKILLGFQPALQNTLTSGGVEEVLEHKLAVLSLVRDKQKDDGDLKYYKRVVEIELKGNIEEVLYDGLLDVSQLNGYSELIYVSLSGNNDETITFTCEVEFDSVINRMKNYLEMDLLLRGER